VSPPLTVRGEGPPVVLIHPLGADRSFWRLLQIDGHTLLTYDLPGHGENGAAVPDRVTLLAADLNALLSANGWAMVHLVGASLGGLVAQAFTAAYPDQVRSLSLVDTVAVYPEPMREMWRIRAALARQQGLSPLAEPTMQTWFSPAAPAELVEAERARFLVSDQEGYAATCDLLCDADESGQRISAPTLVVCGRSDGPAFVAAAEAFAVDIPGSRLLWLENSRHAGVLEEPELFDQALTTFLQDVEGVPR